MEAHVHHFPAVGTQTIVTHRSCPHTQVILKSPFLKRILRKRCIVSGHINSIDDLNLQMSWRNRQSHIVTVAKDTNDIIPYDADTFLSTCSNPHNHNATKLVMTEDQQQHSFDLNESLDHITYLLGGAYDQTHCQPNLDFQENPIKTTVSISNINFLISKRPAFPYDIISVSLKSLNCQYHNVYLKWNSSGAENYSRVMVQVSRRVSIVNTPWRAYNINASFTWQHLGFKEESCFKLPLFHLMGVNTTLTAIM